MLNVILGLLFSLSLLASPREEAANILSKSESYQSVDERMDFISRIFMGLPYGDGGPLGEGEQGRFDQDPLYRFDTYDCTTFVETIVSLALARNVEDFEQRMKEIRYENGEVDYLKRNHFPSLQWIPNNVKNNFLIEINDTILPRSEQALAEAVINLPGWLNSIKVEEIRVPMATLEERLELLEELKSYSTQYAPEIARVHYLPITTLLGRPDLLDKIPHGAIVNFVRPNWDLRNVIGTHMNISHQGFIFHTKNGVTLRHASSSGIRKVTEESLLLYLKKFENHPTMKGIHLMKVNY